MRTSAAKMASSLAEKADGKNKAKNKSKNKAKNKDAIEEAAREAAQVVEDLLEKGFSFRCLVEDVVQAQVNEGLKEKQLSEKLEHSDVAKQLVTKWTSEMVKTSLEDLYKRSEEEAEITTDEISSTLIFKMDAKDIVYPDEETGEDAGGQDQDAGGQDQDADAKQGSRKKLFNKVSSGRSNRGR
eukprot:COSAG02_NODE_20535_length_826_cov_11.618982_2_plen_184_part_00